MFSQRKVECGCDRSIEHCLVRNLVKNASKEEQEILRGISTKRKQKKIETEQARKKALPERSGELSSDEDHMQTNKAASFKNLPPCL